MTENQEAFLKALDSCLGIVSDASEMSGISRTTHYRWLEESEEYRDYKMWIADNPKPNNKITLIHGKKTVED